MAASLSEDEFQRLQDQLLELRSRNYVLEEKAQKYQNDFTQTYQYVEDLKKELSKALKIISRSKSARDVEQLIQENETLQRKLQSQEDEFRLQNETLMQELSSLVSCNEKLQKELELVKTENLPSTNTVIQNEVTRLKAENAAIKKSLAVSHERRTGLEGFASDNIEGGNVGTEDSITKNENTDLTSESDLKLRLEIELEEKKILKEQMQKVERLCKDEILNLSSENNKLNEKLKKKQEVLLQLQEEKEKIYGDLRTLQDEKQNEVQQLKEQIQCMQMQLDVAIQQNEQKKTTPAIENQAENTDEECTIEFIAGQKASFERSLNEAKASLLHSQNELKSLNSQLKDSAALIRQYEEERAILQKEKSNLESLLGEKSNLAEKRKKLMDEMNGHLLEITNKHSKEIESLTQQLAEEQDKLQKLFDKEKEARVELQQAKCEIQNLKEEMQKLRNEKLQAECELKGAHESAVLLSSDCQQQLENCKKEHASTIENLKLQLQSQMKDLAIQLEVAHAEKAEFEEKVIKLQQELKDSVDERKIHEKKGLSMVKDLKRQLQIERKRAEKLQERLQEILSDQNRSVDDILQTGNQADKTKGDASSVSSWSYVSGGTTDKENREYALQSDGSSGGHDSPSRLSPTLLENETSNLLAKVTYLQQKNWTLEEKVNHLEMSNEALVDDLLKKTAIIQYYCMEGRADVHSPVVQDKLTIKRIVDFIKDKGDENLREMNRRMQRMLEETLTKNMHLQKDVETLSNEVSRLSKLSETPDDAELQSTVFLEGV